MRLGAAKRIRRADGGALRRFASMTPSADRRGAGLRPDHPAILLGRSLFQASVIGADEAPRILVSGHNNPKLGNLVLKGPWAGMPIYHLTLEERATCPRDCHLWRECYGNSSHRARRHRLDRALLDRLGWELVDLGREHPQGFVVRLHTLGDFASVRYAAWWAVYLRWLPQLHLFGFTARRRASAIGRVVLRMNQRWPGRSRIRFSAEPGDSARDMAATTIWRWPDQPVIPEGQVCPEQLGATSCCGTCGLCFSPAMAGKRIVFVGHGAKPPGRRRKGE